MQQISFDPLTYLDNGTVKTLEEATKFAMQQRNMKLKGWRKLGYVARGWRLTNQLRKYKSFGVEDGRSRTVFYITVQD